MDNCNNKPITDNGVGPLEHIREVWGSNFGSETGCLLLCGVFIPSSQTRSGTVRCVIPRVCRQVDTVFALLACYTAYSANSLQPIGPTFKDALKVGPTGSPETSVRN